MKNVTGKKLQRTSKYNFFLNLTVYGTMWKNTVKPDIPHMATRFMFIACWIPIATNTQS
jgi:hypothetical protein